MRNLDVSLRVLLAASLILSSVPGSAKESSGYKTAAPAKPVKEAAIERAEQERKAPERIKTILRKRVSAYFPRLFKNAPLPAAQVNQLVNDSTEVASYMEQDDQSGEMKDFAKENLEPYVRSLTAADIASTDGKTPVAGDLSVQSLVVSRMLNFLSKTKEFPAKAMNLVSGKHLKGASHVAVLTVLGSVGYYFFPHAEEVVGIFVLLTFWDAFKAGPIGSILNAGSGWFVRPTSEQLKVLESRYTSVAEVRLNSFFDSLNPKADGVPLTAAEEKADKNDRVKIATLEGDGLDFGGMTAADQIANWEQGLNMFVVVAKRFGQLLRDTHHAGRDLMMLSWTDQQNVAMLVEQLDSKRIILRGESNEVLAPHKTAFLMRGENAKKSELEEEFEAFETFCNKLWQEPDMNPAQLEELRLRVKFAQEKLIALGLSSYDIKRLLEIQKERARAVGTMATTLAIGELRAFYGAERNRNLAPGARLIERSIRKGLGMQTYVDENLPLIQRELRAMNQKVTGRQGVRTQHDPCEIVLTPATGE